MKIYQNPEGTTPQISFANICQLFNLIQQKSNFNIFLSKKRLLKRCSLNYFQTKRVFVKIYSSKTNAKIAKLASKQLFLNKKSRINNSFCFIIKKYTILKGTS